MAAGRKSTIHDLTSLRLHPDGRRVPPNPLAPGPSTAHGSSKSQGKAKADSQDPKEPEDLLYVPRHARGIHTKKTKYAVKDTRGNWIARDAVGFVGVPREVKKRRKSYEEDIDDEDEGENVDVGDMGEGRGSSSTGGEERRARKKRKSIVEKDFGFLASGYENVDEGGAETSGSGLGGTSLPLPSSDLLKCIHHFASAYYTSQGQLFNASAEDWQERKERRARRLQKQKEGNGSGEEDDTDVDDDASMADNAKAKGKGSKKEIRRDMYKKFDGTALMAIGMILQEHVAHILKDSVPPRRVKGVGPKAQQEDDEEYDETRQGARNEDIESEDEDQDQDGDEGVGGPETG